MLYSNDNNNSSSTSFGAVAGTAVLVGFVLFLFMPSVLDRIRGITDFSKPKSLPKGDDGYDYYDDSNEGVLEDDNVGAV